MAYAKYISNESVDLSVPSRAEWNGRVYSGDLSTVPGLLESLGFLPLRVSQQPSPVDGHHWEDRYAYDDPEEPSAIVQSWVSVADPEPEPSVYSKLKILLAAKAAGFLPDLIAMIESDPETKWIWDASNTIEDNELLASYLPAVAQAIGKTAAEVKEFLDQNCLAE